MNPIKRPYRKFLPQQEKIKSLSETNPVFERIYNEYETMSDELWVLESGDCPVTDDFIQSVKQQAGYLEEEIEDWLIEE